MQLELISTKRCPFVQRSVITLNHKGVDYKMTFIDLDDPPQPAGAMARSRAAHE